MALGELCLWHLLYSSLGILLGLFFQFFEKIWMFWIAQEEEGDPGMPEDATGDFSRLYILKATLFCLVVLVKRETRI